MKKSLKVVLSAALAFCFLTPASAAERSPYSLEESRDVAFRIGENDFIVPLKSVSGTQLYSFREGKGYPALESVVFARRTWKASLGAAAELGTSVNVPFLSVATRLSPKFFETDNNDLYFGVWVGFPSVGKKALWGLSASIPLW